MEFIKTGVFLCCGVAAGYAVPNLAEKMIQYKCAKRNQNPPSFYMLKWYKQILMILGVSLFALAAWKMPFAEAVIVCIFVMIALTATVIDIQIRIIANEMVLFLLVLGIIYRIVAGGIHSLLGSIGALAFIIAIFGGAAFITKVITKNIGVGAGDLKLALVIAITVGYSGVFYFLGGMAAALGVYCVAGLKLGLLTSKSTFPMCGHIMAGFLIAIFAPYVLL